MFWKVRHWPTKQKVWSPVLIRLPPRNPLNAGRTLRCASTNCCSFPGFTLNRTTLNAVIHPSVRYPNLCVEPMTSLAAISATGVILRWVIAQYARARPFVPLGLILAHEEEGHK